LLHKSGWTRIAQELLEIPHLDRDTADLVQYLTKQLSCTIQETNKKEGRKTFSLHTAKQQNCIDLDGLVVSFFLNKNDFISNSIVIRSLFRREDL
jgi:hypothetical protein